MISLAMWIGVNVFPALDLRALQVEFMARLPDLLRDALQIHFGSSIAPTKADALLKSLVRVMHEGLDKTATMDNEDRMRTVANSTASTLVNFFAESGGDLKAINEFCSRVASHTAGIHDELRKDYLTGVKGAVPASPYLSKTKGVYEYIRETLGVKMHGIENYTGFVNGLSVDELSIGENISTIYEVCFS
jgi:phenylalanine ammonia-lyase